MGHFTDWSDGSRVTKCAQLAAALHRRDEFRMIKRYTNLPLLTYLFTAVEHMRAIRLRCLSFSLRFCSTGRQTSKVGERMWFFNVGLSGKDGTLNKTWPVKTLETLLNENNHMFVSKRFLILLFVQLIHDAMGVLRGYKL